MKKFLFVVTMGSLLSLGAWAADPVNPLSVDLPAGNLVLPEPPTVGSLLWENDSVVYFEARELRRLKRAVTVEDSTLLALLGVTKKVGTVITVDSLIAKKREPYISWLKTYGADSAINIPTLGDKTVFPYLCRLDSLCEKMKSYNTHESLYRVRQRPYYYFHDYYSGGKVVEKPENYDSYPSGHGYFCGLFGLCMHYIDPGHAKEIKKNSDTFGYQRLILGAHWASDVQAGNILGAIAFAIALNDADFYNLLEDAKQELADYRADVPTTAPSVEAFDVVQEAMKVYDGNQLLIQSNGSTYSLQGALVK